MPRARANAQQARQRDRPGPESHARLSILECLARAEGGLTLTDVAHRVQLPPSTAHRLLSTLERMGYVYQAGELGRWYVGLQAFAVGSSFLSSRDFVAQSHPYMRALMEQVGETANLAILDGTEAVFIDQVQCRETMRTLVKLRQPRAAACVGVGRPSSRRCPTSRSTPS
jgi:IclR family acetate operon transcriptional repressor